MAGVSQDRLRKRQEQKRARQERKKIKLRQKRWKRINSRIDKGIVFLAVVTFGISVLMEIHTLKKYTLKKSTL